MKKVLTTCGYCGCGCNYYLNVQNDEVIGVTPKNDHPVSKGKLCVKGWQGYSFVKHPERLKNPLIRQRDGSFSETTWDHAIGLIVDSFQKISSEYGSEAIGVLSSARCTNEENYLPKFRITDLSKWNILTDGFNSGSVFRLLPCTFSPIRQ